MDSREQFEKWVNKNIEKEFDPIDINDVYKAWEYQATKITELEEKLKLASEALELAKVTFIANKMDVRNVMEVINKALDKMKG